MSKDRPNLHRSTYAISHGSKERLDKLIPRLGLDSMADLINILADHGEEGLTLSAMSEKFKAAKMARRRLELYARQAGRLQAKLDALNEAEKS
jgi:hypothetical protein